MSDESPVDFPPPWRGDALQHRYEAWLYELSSVEIAALRKAAGRALASGMPLSALAHDTVLANAFEPALTRWRSMLAQGYGMVLVRGLPVREMGKEAAGAAYWLLGLLLGTPVPQNAAAELLVDVRDTGADPADHNTRLYKTRADLSFHTDGADIIGLLCLRSGKSGGTSRICSSVEVYNQALSRRPDLVPLLYRPWHHHAHGQFGADGPRTFAYPIVTRREGIFRMLLLLWYIRNAAADFPDIAALGPDECELLDLLEAIPNEPGMALDMEFREGDMQFLKNAVVLHARTEYEDRDEPDEKRHLLRLWLAARELGDGDEALRAGIGTKLPEDEKA